jgi:hypothetical protein
LQNIFATRRQSFFTVTKSRRCNLISLQRKEGKMKRSLSVIVIILASAALSLAEQNQGGRTVTVTLVDPAIQADVAHLAHSIVATDGPIPQVCQDNFRFCIAGCGPNDGGCVDECNADLDNCIKVIHPQE